MVLAFLALVLIQRIVTAPAPVLVAHRTLPARLRIPGSTQSFGWPRSGQAAAEVAGVGAVGTSGRQAPVPIASVAKMMTAYQTLLEHPLLPNDGGFTLRITEADVDEQQRRAALGQSTIPVRAGERLSERQALEALMIPSANNIAALLAARASGGRDAFLARMNGTARRLGMRASTYTDPSGYDDSTVSSASDQLKLTATAMRVPTFAAIVNRRSVYLPVAGRVNNYNGLVGSDGYVGVKTGSDRAAGGCFAFAKRVSVAGRTLTVLGVVLGQREGPIIAAALSAGKRLGDSIAAALRVHKVLAAGTTVLRASTSDGRHTSARTARSLSTIAWDGMELSLGVRARSDVTHVRAGQPLATVSVEGSDLAVTEALATSAVAGPSLGWRVRHAP